MKSVLGLMLLENLGQAVNWQHAKSQLSASLIRLLSLIEREILSTVKARGMMVNAGQPYAANNMLCV